MLLTESAAREKWCPFARVIVEDDNRQSVGSANRMPGCGGGPDPNLDWPSPRCVASDCMAWRRDDTGQDSRTGERRGYCGLAGEPVAITWVAS